jgi:hypothetical protein
MKPIYLILPLVLAGFSQAYAGNAVGNVDDARQSAATGDSQVVVPDSILSQEHQMFSKAYQPNMLGDVIVVPNSEKPLGETGLSSAQKASLHGLLQGKVLELENQSLTAQNRQIGSGDTKNHIELHAVSPKRESVGKEDLEPTQGPLFEFGGKGLVNKIREKFEESRAESSELPTNNEPSSAELK